VHDTIIALMLRLRDKFGVRHVLLEVKREVEPYTIVVAANKAVLFLVEVQYCSSSVRACAVPPGRNCNTSIPACTAPDISIVLGRKMTGRRETRAGSQRIEANNG
jgi:hypothetical protein